MCVCVCVCVCVFVCVCVGGCEWVWVGVFAYVYVCICVYVCMCVREVGTSGGAEADISAAALCRFPVAAPPGVVVVGVKVVSAGAFVAALGPAGLEALAGVDRHRPSRQGARRELALEYVKNRKRLAGT